MTINGSIDAVGSAFSLKVEPQKRANGGSFGG